MKRFAANRLFPHLTPGRALIFYYAAAIFIGAALLATPLAAQGDTLSFLDALFTATSAQCVTGLIVVDTGSRLSIFGQSVVLALIQIGGLGIITFSVYLFIYLRVGVSFHGRWLIHETMFHSPITSWRELIREIVQMTFCIELAGAFVLAFVWIPELGWGRGAWCAVFHSISAFCNAGFSLFPDSLMRYRDNPTVNLTVMGLITLGGIGFLVIRELLDLVRIRKRRLRISLHTRLVLIASAVLTTVGALAIPALEWQNGFSAMPRAEAFWAALFQSVTARTAGFNTLDMATLTSPTLFLLIILMFIGASPGSAGGGVKTTTVALFVGVLWNRMKGNPNTNLFHRSVPEDSVTKGLTLVFLAFILVVVALFALLVAEMHARPPGAEREFLEYAFEAVSAFGTVGLSMNVTPNLTAPAKIIVILLMFVGRVGLLTIAFGIARRPRPTAARYGEENVMIG